MQGQIEIVKKFKGRPNDAELVRLVADRLTLTAQTLLENDKVLEPIAAVLAEKESVLFRVSHADTEAKQLAYSKLRAFAKLNDAHAIIAIGDGTVRTEDDTTEAILTAVRAKSKSYTIVVPYYRHDIGEKQEMIVFMEPYDWTDSKIPLIEAWW